MRDYLNLLDKGYIHNPELYFDRKTGELFNENEPKLELIPVQLGAYPSYENDDYEGYFYKDYFFHPAK